jgi:hypothetical protein
MRDYVWSVTGIGQIGDCPIRARLRRAHAARSPAPIFLISSVKGIGAAGGLFSGVLSNSVNRPRVRIPIGVVAL